MLPGMGGGGAHSAGRRRVKIDAFTCCADVSNLVLDSGGRSGARCRDAVGMLPPAAASGSQLH